MDDEPTATELLEPPAWPWIDDPDRGMFGGILASNCPYDDGGGVNVRVAERMLVEQRLAEFTSRFFHATCWYTDGRFYAAVCIYHEHVATLSADTAADLLRVVNDAYGWS